MRLSMDELNNINTESKTEEQNQISSTNDYNICLTDTNQLPSISSLESDFDQDKIIIQQSNKSEIMTGKESGKKDGKAILLLLQELEELEEVNAACVTTTPRNMLLKRSFSTCLPDSNNFVEEETNTCPTFTFETLNQQSINKEKETCIINNNPTSTSCSFLSATNNDTVVTKPATFSSHSPLSTSANISQISTLTMPNKIPLSTLVTSTSNIPPTSPNVNELFLDSSISENSRNSNNKPPNLWRKLRSTSFDGRLLSSSGGGSGVSDDEHSDVDDDDTCSITTSNTMIATTSDASPRNRLGFSRKQLFPRTKSQRLKVCIFIMKVSTLKFPFLINFLLLRS
jgi:hypothetical protein